MFYVELTLSVLGIVRGLFMLAILYRFFEVLGLLRTVLKRLMFHRNTLKQTLILFHRFCEKTQQRLWGKTMGIRFSYNTRQESVDINTTIALRGGKKKLVLGSVLTRVCTVFPRCREPKRDWHTNTG